MITTLTGSNHFLLKAELDKLVSKFVAEYSDMGLERQDGQEVEYDRMREALQSLPFLANRKLVVLRTPSANKQFVEQAATLLSDLSEITDVIIIEPKLDKRLAYYKFLKSKTIFNEFNELDEQSMAKWLVQQAFDTGGNIGLTDARYLVERLGLNQQLLSNELSKLTSYNPQVSRQTIDLLTDKTPQSTIFELIDAAMAGRNKLAIDLYQEQRKLKIEPQQILAMLVWQLHVLAVVMTAGDLDAAAIASQAKLSPFTVRKTQGIARKITLPELKLLIREVLDLDVALKSQTIDADDALRELILRL